MQVCVGEAWAEYRGRYTTGSSGPIVLIYTIQYTVSHIICKLNNNIFIEWGTTALNRIIKGFERSFPQVLKRFGAGAARSRRS